MMNIRNAKKEDAAPVACLHQRALNESFLGSLSAELLRLIYESLVESDQGLLLVAEEEGKVVGFVSGAVKTGDFYKFFLKRNSLKAALSLLSVLFRKGTVKKIAETVKYSRKHPDLSMPEAELLSMAVVEEYRGRKLAGELFEAFAEQFARKGARTFKIVAGNKLARANGFYHKMGCRKTGEIEVHKHQRSSVYIYSRTESQRSAPCSVR